MEEMFEKIWDKALPYQDKRDDKGHAETTLKFAKKLLKTEKGNEDIVIPAIILHDIGWSQLTRKEWMTIFEEKTRKEELKVRYKHQEESVSLGRKILKELNYPSEKIEEILEIVSQHDTRKGFISKNEGLMRDADKLWRFSSIGFATDLKRFNFKFKKWHDSLLKDIKKDNFFFSEKAKEIANKELKERSKEYSKPKQSLKTP